MIIKSLVTRIKEWVPYTVGFVLATLTLSPTNLRGGAYLEVNDYGYKSIVPIQNI